jgi:hypothetical protein
MFAVIYEMKIFKLVYLKIQHRFRNILLYLEYINILIISLSGQSVNNL